MAGHFDRCPREVSAHACTAKSSSTRGKTRALIDTHVVRKSSHFAFLAHTARFTDRNATLGFRVVAGWRAPHALHEDLVVGAADIWWLCNDINIVYNVGRDTDNTFVKIVPIFHYE